MRYLFFLGREGDIAEAELRALFVRFHVTGATKRLGEHLLFEGDVLPVKEIMNCAGSIVKIAEEAPGHGTREEQIVTLLTTHEKTSKLSFAVQGDGVSPRLAIDIKKKVRGLGKSVRAVTIKNSASIFHNNLIETRTDFTIFQNHVFFTVALQPFEAFSERDFERPASDARSGMLPPKLARTMLNLAGVDHTSAVLDPFCGSGTVLMEAALLGAKTIIGSDLSSKAVHDSQINTEWIQKKEHFHANVRIFISDVRHLSDHLQDELITSVITEPYLGTPLRGGEAQDALEKQSLILRALYKDALRALHNILTPGGIIVMVFPEFTHSGNRISSIEEHDFPSLGFSIEALLPEKTSLLYRRPNQHVGRRLYRLKKI